MYIWTSTRPGVKWVWFLFEGPLELEEFLRKLGDEYSGLRSPPAGVRAEWRDDEAEVLRENVADSSHVESCLSQTRTNLRIATMNAHGSTQLLLHSCTTSSYSSRTFYPHPPFLLLRVGYRKIATNNPAGLKFDGSNETVLWRLAKILPRCSVSFKFRSRGVNRIK